MRKSHKRDHVKDKHGETCMCKRCLGRESALIRKGSRLKLREYYKSAININEND
jgi:hypothetical protein